MKKIIYSFLTIVIITTVTISCKKSESTPSTPAYTCATCKSTPDAVVANDGSNKGVYKGVVIGSTGTIMFNLANSGTTINALMVIDGVTVNLTSAVSIVAGQTYVAPFTGTLNGSAVSITFSVSSIGANPTVTTSSIPGHPSSSFAIIKETSASLVECFEGSYSTTKPQKGTFNLILSRGLKLHSGASRKDGTTTSNPFNGIINANNELIDASSSNYLATLSGDNLSGKFVDDNGSTVTVTAKRTF